MRTSSSSNAPRKAALQKFPPCVAGETRPDTHQSPHHRSLVGFQPNTEASKGRLNYLLVLVLFAFCSPYERNTRQCDDIEEDIEK